MLQVFFFKCGELIKITVSFHCFFSAPDYMKAENASGFLSSSLIPEHGSNLPHF